MTGDSPPTIADPPGSARHLTRVGLLCALFAACASAIVSHDPLPGWGLDPVTTVAPSDGIGPSGEILLAAVSLLGLTLVLAGAALARQKLPGLLLALGAVGLAPVLYHGWLGPDACVENARIGCIWAGAIAGALAAFIACRDPGERGLVLALCAGLVGPLVFRAAFQVYSEHPQLMEDYRARQDEILASHGWLPDSALARSYERRLAQPDASAWFAMSNVYASVMAACAAAFAGGAWVAVRSRLWTTGDRRDLYRFAGLLGGLVLALAGLLIAVPAGGSPSKGGLAAAALGLGLVAMGLCLPRLPKPLRLVLRGTTIGLGVIGLALAAIVARDWLGERIGELSLLFRWYYLEASVRIFGGHPLWGVGPDGFQSAYLIAKNPLNPEEVSSPHNVFFEYLATLGAFGLAWCGVLLVLAANAGRTLVGPGGPATPAPSGAEIAKRLLPIILACTALSFAVQALPLARAVPEAFGLLLLDGIVKTLAIVLLWLGLAAALLSVAHHAAVRVGLAAAALAVLAHAQIELTATDAGAAGWTLLLLGAAAARPQEETRPADRRGWFAAALAGVLVGAMLAAWVPIRAWQASLRAASDSVMQTTALQSRLASLGPDSAPDEPMALLSEVSSLLGRQVEPTQAKAAEAMRELRRSRIAAAADRLEALARNRRSPSRVVAHTAVRLRGAQASLEPGPGGSALEALSRAGALAEWTTARWPNDSRAWRDLAQVREALAAAGAAPAGGSLEALTRAAALDPHSPDLALRVAEAYRSMGRGAEAEAWARRALAAHEAMHLDPLAGLSESQMAALRELLGNP